MNNMSYEEFLYKYLIYHQNKCDTNYIINVVERFNCFRDSKNIYGK